MPALPTRCGDVTAFTAPERPETASAGALGRVLVPAYRPKRPISCLNVFNQLRKLEANTRAGGNIGKADAMHSRYVQESWCDECIILNKMFFLHLAPVNWDAVFCLRTIKVWRQSHDRLYSTPFLWVSEQLKVERAPSVLGVVMRMLMFTLLHQVAMQQATCRNHGCPERGLLFLLLSSH